MLFKSNLSIKVYQVMNYHCECGQTGGGGQK